MLVLQAVPAKVFARLWLHGSQTFANWQSWKTRAERQVLEESEGKQESIKGFQLYTPGFAVCVTALQSLQAEGYLARSAFKLQELQQKHKLIAPGSGSDLLSWTVSSAARVQFIVARRIQSVRPRLQPRCLVTGRLQMPWAKEPRRSSTWHRHTGLEMLQPQSMKYKPITLCLPILMNH